MLLTLVLRIRLLNLRLLCVDGLVMLHQVYALFLDLLVSIGAVCFSLATAAPGSYSCSCVGALCLIALGCSCTGFGSRRWALLLFAYVLSVKVLYVDMILGFVDQILLAKLVQKVGVTASWSSYGA